MSDSSQNSNGIPNKIIDLLVSDIFQKNDINIEEAKKKLSKEQKQLLKELVEDLSHQVDTFMDQSFSIKKEEK
ncbi:spore coat protein [Bacillus sp. FJAT-27231]|uniref:hypothetical protein n=1 Tax=Bacillus sp. FJAT-27231 TaxID=1679168 RepID=UPI00067091AD|nr:hypothetical protein [Bacillus sp. FJAT-27231]KMY54240.1 spore coat protein [Bacillus sp. FJAT-27231]